MQVPHITIEHIKQTKLIGSLGEDFAKFALDICNTAIEIALAKQSQEQSLISAEEARKLFENGQAVEMLMSGEVKWLQCTATNTWTDDFYGRTIKYRAIKQPEPLTSLPDELIDPEAKKALGEWIDSQQPEPVEPTTIVNSERMTLSAAEALKVKLGDSVEWFDWSPMRSQTKSIGNWKFSAEDFYSYTEKANLVKLNGKLVTREAAIAEWGSKKDTCDVWFKSNTFPEFTYCSAFYAAPLMEDGGEYELREHPLKQISWKDVPVGVAVQDKRNGVVWLYMGSSELEAVLVNIPSRPFCSRFIELTDLELAPADQQPWIAVQDEFTPANGLIYKFRYGLASQITMNETVIAFKVTDIAKGWVLK